TSDAMPQVGQYYSETEYDLTLLKTSGRTLLDLGRSCLHADYRGGMAMAMLWNGLAQYVQDHGVEVLFGTASFQGTNVAALAQPLSYLHHHHLAPSDLRVCVKGDPPQTMDLLPKDQIDRKTAMLNTPALIKGYLRLGGVVGQGAYVDHVFNTTDICLIIDTAQMNTRHRNFYDKRDSPK
ncbi:MAG: GNAT family N-acyltransferase, partial [Pseudomonadota bacterium]